MILQSPYIKQNTSQVCRNRSFCAIQRVRGYERLTSNYSQFSTEIMKSLIEIKLSCLNDIKDVLGSHPFYIVIKNS